MFQFAAFETSYPYGVVNHPFAWNFRRYLNESPMDVIHGMVYFHGFAQLTPSRVYRRTHDAPVTPYWATLAGCMGGE